MGDNEDGPVDFGQKRWERTIDSMMRVDTPSDVFTGGPAPMSSVPMDMGGGTYVTVMESTGPGIFDLQIKDAFVLTDYSLSQTGERAPPSANDDTQ
jgi:hypothetical protein